MYEVVFSTSKGERFLQLIRNFRRHPRSMGIKMYIHEKIYPIVATICLQFKLTLSDPKVPVSSPCIFDWLLVRPSATIPRRRWHTEPG